MHINLRTDYALRAIIEIASADPESAVKRDEISEAQSIPPKYLAAILTDLRRGGLVTATRGRDGGYRLARHPREISLADVIRVVGGALTLIGGVRPENVEYEGNARGLADVWLRLRVAEREILESISLDAVARRHVRLDDHAVSPDA